MNFYPSSASDFFPIRSDDAHGVLLHVRRRRADDDEQSSFREFIVTENKKTTKKRGLQSERLRRSELVEGEHRESRSRRFVLLLFAFLFLLRTSLASSSSSFDERFSGSFADPNHPGCPREITPNGVLRGYDPVPFEKGKGCRGRKVVTPEDVFAIPRENHAVLGNPNQTGWKSE